MSDPISRDKLNECIKRWYEHMGVDTHGVWNKQLAEIVKGMDEDDLALEFRFLLESIRTLPSVNYVTEKTNDVIKPSNDVINRQDAIECCSCLHPEDCWAEIKALPSASVGTEMSLPKWIPCSERLPENGRYYLWCSDMGAVQSDYYWNGFENGTKYGYNIIAWMPLPPSYKGGDDE